MKSDYGTITSIESEGIIKKLICEEGQTFEAKAVIIATGTKPRMLGVPGELNFAGSAILDASSKMLSEEPAQSKAQVLL